MRTHDKVACCRRRIQCGQCQHPVGPGCCFDDNRQLCHMCASRGPPQPEPEPDYIPTMKKETVKTASRKTAEGLRTLIFLNMSRCSMGESEQQKTCQHESTWWIEITKIIVIIGMIVASYQAGKFVQWWSQSKKPKTRSVCVQSQTTYARHLHQPRFQVITEKAAAPTIWN